MNTPTIRTYAAAAAHLEGARNRHLGRPVANNTRLVDTVVHTPTGRIEAIGVRLHDTIVVAYLPDGRTVLNTGGWFTVTTQDRINAFSPARVYAEIIRDTDGTTIKRWNGKPQTHWVIASASPIYTTPPKVQRCRVCRGTGVEVHVQTHGYVQAPGVNNGRWEDSWWIEYQTPERHEHTCYRCDGTGQRDYGSHAVHPEFHNGIIVDENGEVVA